LFLQRQQDDRERPLGFNSRSTANPRPFGACSGFDRSHHAVFLRVFSEEIDHTNDIDMVGVTGSIPVAPTRFFNALEGGLIAPDRVGFFRGAQGKQQVPGRWVVSHIFWRAWDPAAHGHRAPEFRRLLPLSDYDRAAVGDGDCPACKRAGVSQGSLRTISE